ncbi:hypothetical protein [Streptomyces sp. E5N91]|nr:hypothetical protein [Streptomyces sp. E5N91]
MFMTEDVERWPEYLDLLSGIMKSVSPDEASTTRADDPVTGERAEGEV